MSAWEAGIVVVASAGNTGPAPMSMQVPGDVPYVFTVGAMSDNYSQATAVVSGVVMLILQAEPTLKPDEVKCRLIAAARPALDGNGALAYSALQQGAGMANAYDAVHSFMVVRAVILWLPAVVDG